MGGTTIKLIVLGLVLCIAGLYGGVRMKNFRYVVPSHYSVSSFEEAARAVEKGVAKPQDVKAFQEKLKDRMAGPVLRIDDDYVVSCDGREIVRRSNASHIFLVHSKGWEPSGPIGVAAEGTASIIGYSFTLVNNNTVINRPLENYDTGVMCLHSCPRPGVNLTHCGEAVAQQHSFLVGIVEPAGVVERLYQGNVQASWATIGLGAALALLSGRLGRLVDSARAKKKR